MQIVFNLQSIFKNENTQLLTTKQLLCHFFKVLERSPVIGPVEMN